MTRPSPCSVRIASYWTWLPPARRGDRDRVVGGERARLGDQNHTSRFALEWVDPLDDGVLEADPPRAEGSRDAVPGPHLTGFARRSGVAAVIPGSQSATVAKSARWSSTICGGAAVIRVVEKWAMHPSLRPAIAGRISALARERRRIRRRGVAQIRARPRVVSLSGPGCSAEGKPQDARASQRPSADPRPTEAAAGARASPSPPDTPACVMREVGRVISPGTPELGRGPTSDDGGRTHD